MTHHTRPELLSALMKFHTGPRCCLEFDVETPRFGAATSYPILDALRRRVTLLRLTTHPLVSYNHFTISHLEPWEFRLSDHEFAVRFSVKSTQDQSEAPYLTVNNSHTHHLQRIFDISAGLDWARFTPWRLAADRLDDAVFKLECKQPDAILDLVIAIESIFVESGNRQESTHKVATRISRYLGKVSSERVEIFRSVKELYGIRSRLAHGQPWALDKNGYAQVEQAAHLLVRVLRNMLENGTTEVPHLALDLD